MAKKSMIAKAAREPKFKVRGYTRCQICGRPHSVLRDFGICRVCFRKMANEGLIPGVRKSSWQAFSLPLETPNNSRCTFEYIHIKEK